METCSALLTLCAGNSPATNEFPAQRPVTRSFDVFLDKRLSKQSWGWWFETPSSLLWRHCNDLEPHFLVLCCIYFRSVRWCNMKTKVCVGYGWGSWHRNRKESICHCDWYSSKCINPASLIIDIWARWRHFTILYFQQTTIHENNVVLSRSFRWCSTTK